MSSMTDDSTTPKRGRGRPSLLHTEAMQLKLHADLMQHLREQAKLYYCTPAEYIRQLLVADMRTKKFP